MMHKCENMLNQKWQHETRNDDYSYKYISQQECCPYFTRYNSFSRCTIFAQTHCNHLRAVVEHSSITILRSATHYPLHQPPFPFYDMGLQEKKAAKFVLTIDRYPSPPPSPCQNLKLSSLVDVQKQMSWISVSCLYPPSSFSQVLGMECRRRPVYWHRSG